MAIDAGRLKHLELIQKVITRMANNSFLLKGWSVTILSAILAIAASKDGLRQIVWIGFLPAVMFWLLDGYFLRQERLYRKLWDRIRAGNQEAETDFSMDTAVVEFRRQFVGPSLPHQNSRSVPWGPCYCYNFLNYTWSRAVKLGSSDELPSRMARHVYSDRNYFFLFWWLISTKLLCDVLPVFPHSGETRGRSGVCATECDNRTFPGACSPN